MFWCLLYPAVSSFTILHAFWCFSNLFKFSDVFERLRWSVGVHFLFVNKFACCVVQFLNTLLRGVVTLLVCEVWLLRAELCSTYFGQWATVLLFCGDEMFIGFYWQCNIIVCSMLWNVILVAQTLDSCNNVSLEPMKNIRWSYFIAF